MQAQRNCIDCCDVDVLGGFLVFGDGDDDGRCAGCGRALMGTFADLRAFRSKVPYHHPFTLPIHTLVPRRADVGAGTVQHSIESG